jgi:hypothetical protein
MDCRFRSARTRRTITKCLRIRAQRAVEYRPAKLIIRRPMHQKKRHGGRRNGGRAGVRCDARTDSLSTNFQREGLLPATSWRVVYESFSASSRNSSGTDREGPNTTDPYPTASHPKRLRIMSTARSPVQRAIPLSVPGLRFSSSSPSGSSSCTFQCFSRCDTEIASSDMVFSSGSSASVVRTSSSAISARVAVAEIGASSLAAFSKCGALEFRTVLRSA